MIRRDRLMLPAYAHLHYLIEEAGELPRTLRQPLHRLRHLRLVGEQLGIMHLNRAGARTGGTTT